MRTFPGMVDLLDTSQLFITAMYFESHLDHDPADGLILSCLIARPLPEEEELEDELFAGTSEEGAPGNYPDV